MLTRSALEAAARRGEPLTEDHVDGTSPLMPALLEAMSPVNPLGAMSPLRILVACAVQF